MDPCDVGGSPVPNLIVGAPRPRYWVEVGSPSVTEPPSMSKLDSLAMPKVPRSSMVPPGASTKMLPEEKLCSGLTSTVPSSTNVHFGHVGLLAMPAVPKAPPAATTLPVLTKSPTRSIWVRPDEASSKVPELVKVPVSTKVLLGVSNSNLPAFPEPLVALRSTQLASVTFHPAGTVPFRTQLPMYLPLPPSIPPRTSEPLVPGASVTDECRGPRMASPLVHVIDAPTAPAARAGALPSVIGSAKARTASTGTPHRAGDRGGRPEDLRLEVVLVTRVGSIRVSSSIADVRYWPPSVTDKRDKNYHHRRPGPRTGRFGGRGQSQVAAAPWASGS
jgi:hypothetical protein